MKKLRTLLVEDHQLLAEALRKILEDTGSYHVLAVCSDVEQMKSLLEAYHPELVILDINLKGQNSLDHLTERLLRKTQSLVLLTSHPTAFLEASASAYACFKGCLPKFLGTQELLAALERLLQDAKPPGSLRVPTFSPREKEVAHLLLAGLSEKQIADRLCIALMTVKSHKKNLLHKTQSPNTSAMLRSLLEQGVILLS
ncbi:MAG: response regulator transcription factor [Cytophagales bacterium]|nr:response regulator transcription factor [Cytophagales bacterium]